MTSRNQTLFSLFIIESLGFDDESKGRFEGKVLTDILRMSRQGIEVDYLYIRTRKELSAALKPGAPGSRPDVGR